VRLSLETVPEKVPEDVLYLAGLGLERENISKSGDSARIASCVSRSFTR
jgi:hypothetical protein